MRRLIGLASFFLCLVPVTAALAAPLPLVVEVRNSRGLRAGDAVVLEGRTIGKVTAVGFGEHDTVDVRVEIDSDHRARVRKSSTFVINEAPPGRRPTIELFVIDPASSPAEPGSRFQGTHSIAEVWLRRGRVSAGELSRAMAEGVDAFRKNLDRLERSAEWASFKDQIARLSAELTVTGAQLAELLNSQLPKLQQELDGLYAEYRKELERKEREKKSGSGASR